MFVCCSQYYSNGKPFKDISEITLKFRLRWRAREGRIVPHSPVNLNQFRSEHFNLSIWRAKRSSKWRQIFFSWNFSCN